MKPFVPTVIALTLSVASLAAGAVQPPRPDLFGEPVSAAEARRVIVIDDNTKWVNVNHREVVKFVVQGREFAWAFDGMPSGSFDLNQIAPAGTLARTVRVYIAPTDGELNGG